MKDLVSVISFEYFSKIKQKSVKVTLAIILIIALIGTSIPTAISLFKKMRPASGQTDLSTVQEKEENQIDMVENWGYMEELETVLGQDISNIPLLNKARKYQDIDDMTTDIDSGIIKGGVFLENQDHIQTLIKYSAFSDMNINIIQENIEKYYFEKNLESKGIDIKDIEDAQRQVFKYSTITTSDDTGFNYIFGFGGLLIVYFLILFYGVGVATTVAREKNDRTMEILITNTRPEALIWGKVIASVFLSISQLLILLLTIALGIYINRANYPLEVIGLVLQNLSLSTVLIYIGFALLGTFLYYFLYAALGALVNKVEEVGNATSPIQLIFVASYMLCIMAMQNPDSALMRIISLIPFSAPMAMFVRTITSEVPIKDIIFSLSASMITIWFMGIIAIKIYRLGTLNYGNRMRLMQAIRLAFKNEGTV